jgi:hypothetical protein
LDTNALEVDVGFYHRKIGNPNQASPSGSVLYFDAVILEDKNTFTGYFDGSVIGYEWIGAGHSSVSRAKTGIKAVNVSQPGFYSGTALALTSTGPGRLELELIDPKSVTGSVDYTVDLKVMKTSNSVGKMYLEYLPSGESTIATDTLANEIIVHNQHTTIPSGKTDATIKYTLYGVDPGTSLYINEAGLTQGTTYGWVAESVDPVEAIVNAGAKPAGLVLWHVTFTTTWDIVEAELENWDEWDTLEWDAFEMLGLDLP